MPNRQGDHSGHLQGELPESESQSQYSAFAVSADAAHRSQGGSMGPSKSLPLTFSLARGYPRKGLHQMAKWPSISPFPFYP